MRGYGPEHLPVRNQTGYKAAARLLFGPYLSLRGIEVEGLENLPQGNAPYILAMNHRNLLDIPVIGRVMLDHDQTQIHFVAKKELWKSWPLKQYLDSTDVIKFDRDKAMKDQPEVTHAMNDVLQNNGVLGMYPEHTRRTGPRLQIQKRGLGMLAVGNLAPIATAGIYGTESYWSRIYVYCGKTAYPGPIGDDNRRRRMIEMEAEYQESLQRAIYGAYEMAGAVYDLGEEDQA